MQRTPITGYPRELRLLLMGLSGAASPDSSVGASAVFLGDALPSIRASAGERSPPGFQAQAGFRRRLA